VVTIAVGRGALESALSWPRTAVLIARKRYGDVVALQPLNGVTELFASHPNMGIVRGGRDAAHRSAHVFCFLVKAAEEPPRTGGDHGDEADKGESKLAQAKHGYSPPFGPRPLISLYATVAKASRKAW
jgi:hypothetical protein